MRTAELTLGRSIVVVLEPGDEVVASVRAACAEYGISQGYVPMLSGAFRAVELIATTTPVADEEPPLPDRVTVPYTEGTGCGTVMFDEETGAGEPHLHVAVGIKNSGGEAYAGHLIQATTHYTVEIVITEVLSPLLARVSDPAAFGIPTLHPRPVR
ncbi:MAG: PPC domain-containing DNA-binding protein [Mycetocola sp.]